MIEGVQVEVQDGFAYVEFLDPSKRGEVLAKLIEVAGRGMVDVDTGGVRKTYIVPESFAQQAGLVPPPEPVAKAAPARKRKAD